MNGFSKALFGVLGLVAMALGPVGTASAQVKVTAATPASTTQGTLSLDVVVSGSGFDNTAKVQYLVSGSTSTGGITVKKVVVRNSRELVTTIDVADTATVASFDIQVTLDSGRKGKGTTLFTVQRKVVADPCPGQTAAFVFTKDAGSGTEQNDFYLANASAACQRYLFSVSSGNYERYSSFRIIETATGQEGRIVTTDGITVVLLARFPIGADMQVDPASVVVRRIVEAPVNGYIDVDNFQLAADGHRLAYVASHRTNGTTDHTQLRLIDDVDACIPATPTAPGCAYDVGALLAEHYDLPSALGKPRWNPDGSWIYLEDRRGDFSNPYISRVSPQAPLPPGGQPEIVLAGSSLNLYELRSRVGEELMVYGEKFGTACRELKVVRTATCSNGLCAAQINSVAPRVLVSRNATVQAIDTSSMTILAGEAKEDRKGVCVNSSTGQIIRAVDSTAAGVQLSPVVTGWWPIAR